MSSFTSGKISRDPRPWRLSLNNGTTYRTAERERLDYDYDPRPDNHNPILVEFRERETLGGRHNHFGAVQWANFTERVSYWDGSICSATPDQITHAHRVLAKLAALS